MNKKLARVGIYFLFLLVIVGIVRACDPEDSTTYKDPVCYTDQNFYSNSDPNQWDWRFINPDYVNWEDERVYSSANFYQALKSNPQLYSNIDYSLYLKSAGCNCVCSNCADFHDMKITESTIQHPKGDVVTPGDYPAGTLFEMTEGGINIILPKNFPSNFEPPISDTVTISSINDVNIHGVNFRGDLTFIMGVPVILPGKVTTVNGVVIDNARYHGKSPVFIYFNFNEQDYHEYKNYVGFNDKSLYLKFEQRTRVSFLPGNKYFDVKNKEKDRLIFDFYSGLLSVTNRDSEKLVPLVKTPSFIGEIYNGANVLRFRDEVFGAIVCKDCGSVPMYLVIQNSGKSFMFDNSQSIFTVPGKYPENLYNLALQKASCYENFYEGCYRSYAGNSLRLGSRNSLSVKDRLNTLPFKVEYPAGATPAQLQQISDNIENLPPELSNSIVKIFYSDKQTINKICGGGVTCADISGNIYVDITSDYTMSFETLSHEAAHTATFRIDETARMGFREEWENVAGAYKQNLGPGTYTEAHLSTTWDTGERDPRNGFFSAYAANNYYEDIAVTYEKIVREPPSYFRPYITPGNSDYDIRYVQKIQLLYIYNFIELEQCTAILGRERCRRPGST